MSRGYSQDIREKAFKFLELGETVLSISKRLDIHPRTLGDGISPYKKTGTYVEKIPYRYHCRRIFKDLAALIE